MKLANVVNERDWRTLLIIIFFVCVFFPAAWARAVLLRGVRRSPVGVQRPRRHEQAKLHGTGKSALICSRCVTAGEEGERGIALPPTTTTPRAVANFPPAPGRTCRRLMARDRVRHLGRVAVATRLLARRRFFASPSPARTASVGARGTRQSCGALGAAHLNCSRLVSARCQTRMSRHER